MKIGVIKLGARITWDREASVTSGEAISICEALTKGGAEVHVFTKILSKDTLDESIKWHNILDDRDTSALDAVMVINGNVNFFGGAEDRAQILNYEIMNNFSGPVIYVMCDPELPLLQIWENVSKKQDDPKYQWENKYDEKDVLVTKPIHVLCQPFNVVAMKEVWTKKKGTVPLGTMFHFPMERFPLLNEWLEPASEPAVDLLYGGTARGGRRIPNLFKWYWNLPEDISVEIFGKIADEDFTAHPKLKSDFEARKLHRPPAFTGMVKYCDVLPKMNNSLAHLVTGDPSYETLDLIPQRVAECIAAGNVVFVDANIDKSRRIYPKGTSAHDFLYVANQEELIERLRAIKEDPVMRLQIIDEQRTATSFNADKFCASLVNAVFEVTKMLELQAK
jgi:hypothetical protein